jgi:subtilisin-like proprotein convertase family protein
MDPTTVTAGTVVLRNPTNAVVPGTVSYDAATRVATLKPTAALTALTTYTVTIAGGSSGVKDIAGNPLASSVVWSFTTRDAPTCPCSTWDASSTPSEIATTDTGAIELGVRFRADTNGVITGVRFFKAATNTGTHTGSLWSNAGTLLATATLASETESGWQTVAFATPFPITANTTYVASYHTNTGNYAAEHGAFASAGVDNAPLHLLADGVDGPNGVFADGPGGIFPSDTFQSTNYRVDVVFTVPPPDTTAPTVTSVTPADGATGVSLGARTEVTFSEAMDPASITAGTVVLRNPGHLMVPSTVSFNAVTNVATLRPTAALAASTTYTATITGGSGGVTDMAGNPLASTVVRSFTTGAAPACPCTTWDDSATPGNVVTETTALELGVRFRADASVLITGVRFYKDADNDGTHTGSVWSNTGTLLATATFTSETASGWQQVTFSTPVRVRANTTYVASYHTNTGHYAADNGAFASAGVDNAPMHLLANGVDGPDGVFVEGAGGVFPTDTFQSTNYWVDVVFVIPPPDTTSPAVTGVTPADGATGVSVTVNPAVTFSELMDTTTLTTSTIVLRDPVNAVVPGAVSYNEATSVATLTPTAALAPLTTYTVTIAGASDGVKDLVGNALPMSVVRSFTTGTGPTWTCPCTIFSPSATPAAAVSDTGPIELGVRFRAEADGVITGVRFYKGNANTGPHTGSLWSNSGTLLATAAFTNETALGWQQVTFSPPVAIAANTTYIASYHTSGGGYSVDNDFFPSTGVDNAPLHALATSVDGANGVYLEGDGGFPTLSFRDTNYWVDVVFGVPAVDPPPPTALSVSPTTLPASGGPRGVMVSVFNGPGNPGDVVRLFLSSAPDTATAVDWKYLNGLNATPATGVTSATVTFTMPATAGIYNVRFFPNGSAVSTATSGTIVVGAPPTISTQPLSQPVASNHQATISVAATGSETLTYQWYVGNSGTTTSPVPGAALPAFTTPILTGNTSYWVRVSGPSGVADSAAALITTPPTITTANTWPVATAGTAYELSLQATNSLAPFQWTAAALPSGLTLTSATGGVSGTPNAPGTFSFTIRATGADGLFADRAFNLTVTTATDLLLDQQWYLKDKSIEIASANVQPAWPITKGAGVVIGIVDDGLQGAHPDLQTNYVASLSHDFNGGDNDPSPATSGTCDTTANCRGTWVAGIAAARSGNGLGGSGVAPLASLAGLRLAAESATDAVEAAAFSHELNAVQIENQSWHRADEGHTLAGPGPLAEAAVATAIARGRAGLGRVFVWAAGDGGGNGDNCNFDGYANSRFGIAVGAVDDAGQQPAYSESCSALLVSAPSSGGARSLTTTDLAGPAGSDPTDYTAGFGGTAAAAPVVSGVAALMLARNPALTWRDVQHIFVRSSRQVNVSDLGWTTGPFPHSEKYGFGVVDALAAVNLAATWTNVAVETALPAVAHSVQLAIPDNLALGVSDDIVVGADLASFMVEHVEIELNATHAHRGDLEVTLTSPSGVVSHLATARPGDTGAGFAAWRFRSVRHWGEMAAGRWTLTIADRAAGTTGTFDSWTLRVYGAAGVAPPPPPPIQPPPLPPPANPGLGPSAEPAAAPRPSPAPSQVGAPRGPGVRPGL